MNTTEFATAMKHLSLVFRNELTEEDTKIYYSYLKDYDFQTFKEAVKTLVKQNKFMPKISEIIEQCEKVIKTKYKAIVTLMKDDGYFKCLEEEEKTLNSIERGLIPDWLQKDMNKFVIELKEKKQIQ